jgi:hypothetical protein
MNILLIIILALLLFKMSCYFLKSYSSEKANVLMEELKKIAHDVPNNIIEHSEKLRNKLKNTSFVEITGGDPRIVGWNYNKGREIGIRFINKRGDFYSYDIIVDTLLHELAHSVTENHGHGSEWVNLNNYLQALKPRYVSILRNKYNYNY